MTDVDLTTFRNGFGGICVWLFPNEIEFEGLTLTLEPPCHEDNLRWCWTDGGKRIQPGNTYIAARNTGPHLFTCDESDRRGWVVPIEQGYPFDWSECRKVLTIDGEEV